MVVALLAGGTGGAKLAVGLRDILHGPSGQPAGEPVEQPGELNVIANTGDDIEIYDSYVSPDPDLISFRLAVALDERGFGLRGEQHTQMESRRAVGEEIWFELGDDDLVVCRIRAAALAKGYPLTKAHELATTAYPAGGARVLPMSDDPVRTVVHTDAGKRPLQQFLIQDKSSGTIANVEFDGAANAKPTPQVLAAIESAELIVIGPSNPAISIAPILAVAGIREAIAAASAPVLAVSPYVAGKVLKGPTEEFMTAMDVSPGPVGVAEFFTREYGDLVDAYIGDEPIPGSPHHLAEVLMDSNDAQRAVAAEVLRYGASLA